MSQRMWACSAAPFIFSVTILLTSTSVEAQVDAKTVLNYKPIQRDVDIETPAENEVANCKLDIERYGKGSGWALLGAQGQILRRFLDTDGDSRVDEYRYFKHGLEVYRDIDTNADNEVDEFRWLNIAGTRWGVDADKDGIIDSWKQISAEEATREAIAALVTQDVKRLEAVMLSRQDIKTLGISGDSAKKLEESASDLPGKMRSAMTGKVLNANSKWTRFDSSMLMPNLIPAEPGKTSKDVTVYENVMAIVETAGESGFVQVGEMIRVDDVWKLTHVPVPLDGTNSELASAGILLQPGGMGSGGGPEGLSPEMKTLIDELRDWDQKAPQANATIEDISKYNVGRSRILKLISAESTNSEERKMWQRQLYELIAAATQMGSFPNGLDELKQAETELSKTGDTELLAFVAFQRLLAEYNLSLTQANAAEQPKLQEQWLKSLQAFVQRFPTEPDSADAMLQLAITYEFNGNANEAKQWYENLAKAFPQSQSGSRANGALKRLALQGKQLDLKGKSLTDGRMIDVAAYRGKVLAIIYWSTYCKPCTEDLPQIQELYRVYQRDGFEVLGVNLDQPGAPVDAYLKNYKVTWPHIYEEGGFESRPAVEFGVISQPTIFVLDKTGVVASSSASLADLKTLVPELTKK